MKSNKKTSREVWYFLKGLLGGYKKELSKIIFIAVLGSLLTVVVPFIYGKLFDLALVPNTTITLLLSLIGVWAFLSLISNYTSAKTTALGETLGAKISLTSESEAYAHFLTLPVAFHKNKKTGEVLEKVSRGSWRLQNFIEMASGFFPSILFLIFAIVIMLVVEWQLGLIIILTFIVYAYVTFRMTKPLLKAQRKMHRTFEKRYGEVYDRLYNVFLIKNFALEENEKKNFHKSLIRKALPSFKEATEKFARMQHVQGVIYNISFVLILGIAIFFLRDGSITQGEFVMFFGYINLSFTPFFRLSGFYRDYKRAAVAIKRITNLRKLVPESMKHGNKTIENFSGKINFEKVSFNYEKGKEVLKEISFGINPGESVAFVGESGVGKTTLSELILGYYKPKKGEIFFDKIEISKLKLNWIRKQIAVVPQEISVFNDTLINNIKIAKQDANLEQVIAAAKLANAHDFISKFPKKYNTLVGERGVKLSVGQKQRIAITMAFLKNPKILILDEPTASLDAKSEVNVQRGVEKLMKGRTTLIIAHRFSTVQNADKIVVLDKGKIVEMGNHKELIKKRGKYFELYSLQKGIN